MELETIHLRLKEAREAAGISRERFAVELRTSYGTIANWERGAAAPRADTIPTVCKILGVSSDWLFGISDDGGPSNG